MPKPFATPQLDLFNDARDQQLINETAGALTTHDLSAALESFGQLVHEFPQTAVIPHFAELLALLDDLPLQIENQRDLETHVNRLQQQLMPHAQTALGPCADSYMRPLWRQAAQAAEHFTWMPDKAHLHSAALYLRAGDFAAAAEAASNIPHWHRTTQALQWACLGHYGASGESAARPLLFALAWQAPRELEACIAALRDKTFLGEWQRFESSAFAEAYDGEGLGQWFPVWCLIEQAPLRARFDRYELAAWNGPGPNAFRLLLSIFDLEKSGHSRDLIAARERLREQNPALFNCYMDKRRTQYL